MLDDPNLINSEHREIIDNLDNLITSLNVEMTKGKKLGLKFFIPHAHRGVSFREAAKNTLVYATFLLRNSYWFVLVL